MLPSAGRPLRQLVELRCRYRWSLNRMIISTHLKFRGINQHPSRDTDLADAAHFQCAGAVLFRGRVEGEELPCFGMASLRAGWTWAHVACVA